MFNAGVAQLVEHNLAKVGVAGSNPVARSIIKLITDGQWLVDEASMGRRFSWRRTQVARERSAKPLSSGSNPLVASNKSARLFDKIIGILTFSINLCEYSDEVTEVFACFCHKDFELCGIFVDSRK